MLTVFYALKEALIISVRALFGTAYYYYFWIIMMQPGSNYDLLIGKMDEFIRRYYLNKLLRGLIFLGAALFFSYLLITFSEYFGHFNTLFRSFIFYGFILLNLSLFFWLVAPPLLAYFRLGKLISHDQAAEIIGRYFQNVQDKLLNTLQLKKIADQNPERKTLIEASINQKIAELKPVTFSAAVRINENKRFLKWVLIPLVLIIMVAFVAPSIIHDGTERIIKHNEYFAPKAPFGWHILNKSLSVVQGGDLKLDLKLTGNEFPESVYLETGKNSFKLDKENLSSFYHTFSNVQNNIRFRLTGGDFSSEEFEIKVNPKPSLLHLDARLIYPSYLHKPAENINNAGDLTLPEGTTVQWELHTENANEVLFSLNQKKTLITSDNELFKHQERLLKSGSYAVKPINRFVSSADSAAYRIAVIPDLPPVIAAGQKADSISAKAHYFTGKIQDDYGFSSLTFHYSVRNPSSPTKNKNYRLPVKADLGQTSSTFFYFWDLKEVSLNPGDELSYYFDVADNDGVNGAKHSRTPEQTLRIPTETEQNKQLDAGTQSVKNKMQSAIKLSAEVERDAQKLNRLLLDKKTLSFDEKKQVEDLLQKRRELEGMVKDMQKENEQNLYDRQETKQQNQEILEKQKQINDLFKNVLDGKTKELLKSLEQMLQQNQKEETREDVSKMQMDNKSLQKELDRMLELYKQLEFDQKLNENINQLDKIAEKQQQLAEKSAQTKQETNQLKQEQEAIKKDFQELGKSLKDLEQKNGQLDNKNNFETPKAEQKEAEQQMDKSEENLSKNDRQKASQSQQQAARQMQKMSSKMKQMQQQGEEKEAQVNVQQLRSILKNLITSSFNQEKVMQIFKQLNAADPDYVNQTQQQQNIKDNLKTVEDSLFALSKRVPQIEATVNKEITAINTNIDQAITNLGDRRTAEANRDQQFAMTSMNNLALMLNEVLDQLQNMMKNAKPGSGKQKQPSMQQLSRMQQELNKNMQKARQQMQQQGNQGQPGQQKGGMSEQMAKMARQQEMIRRALQNINQQENKDGKNGLGNLGDISKQMEQTERDLVNKKIETETLIRQQKIQTRLLEAEKAEQERQQDQKRESQAGKNNAPGYQKALQTYQQLKNKQTEQLITIPTDVNLFYKSKIKTYFNEINHK